MLLLAMSCFQGRPQDVALDALVRHGADGVQLTPGNLPSSRFRDRVATTPGAHRYHHGFCWQAYRRSVYDDDGQPLDIGANHSVHPPRSSSPARRSGARSDGLQGTLTRLRFRRERSPLQYFTEMRDGRGKGLAFEPTFDWSRWLPIALAHDLIVETMYPGYLLANEAELDAAMAAGLRLAVDVSHLEIQRYRGVLSDAGRRRVLLYDRIEEIHVSTSRRGSDAHAPLTSRTPGLGWARERVQEVPVVIESYWHRLSFDDQRRQVDLLREPAGR